MGWGSIFAAWVMGSRYSRYAAPADANIMWWILGIGAFVFSAVLCHGLTWSGLAVKISFWGIVGLPFVVSAVNAFPGGRDSKLSLGLSLLWAAMFPSIIFFAIAWIDGKLGGWS